MSDVAAFLAGTAELPVTSSNVRSARYDPLRGVLSVTYKNATTYSYGNVSVYEAEGFANAPSKGGWLWDNIRVRGSKTEHQKPIL